MDLKINDLDNDVFFTFFSQSKKEVAGCFLLSQLSPKIFFAHML